MSQTLTLELSDEVYNVIRRQAAAAGISPAQVAATSLERQFAGENGMRMPAKPRTDAEIQAARDRFEKHFGAVDLGHATGTDNESIDADLAREYADPHEVP
jgi:hypothetical protein